MQNEVISEYINNDHKELLEVLREYLATKKSSSVGGFTAFQNFTKQIQDHVGREEAILPLLQKAIESISTDIELLKKEHQAIRELVARILQKMQEGTYTGDEEKPLQALLLNHMKSEKSVLSILDIHLNEQERNQAINDARKFLKI